MRPQDLYEQDQVGLWDEDAVEQLMAEIRRYFEFWEIAGRSAPRVDVPRERYFWFDDVTGLWICQLGGEG